MNTGGSTFSLGGILNGVNRTLGIANQVIPLWQQTKPLINNAKTAYQFFKQRPKTKGTKKPAPAPVINEKKAPPIKGPQFFI